MSDLLIRTGWRSQLLTCCSDAVEANKGVEARRCPRQDSTDAKWSKTTEAESLLNKSRFSIDTEHIFNALGEIQVACALVVLLFSDRIVSLWVCKIGGIDVVVQSKAPICSVSLHQARDEHKPQHRHVDPREDLAHQCRLAHAK